MAERTRRGRAWTVRTRILAAILVVTAVGLAVTGSLAYLIQRDLLLDATGEQLQQQVESARRVIEVDEVAVTSPSDALRAIVSVVVPPPNGSSVGIIDGEAAFVPGIEVPFRLDLQPGFIAHVVGEADPEAVRVGTFAAARGDLRYVIAPVVIDGADGIGWFVVAIDLDAELATLERTFLLFAVISVLALGAVAVSGWFVAGRLLRPVRLLRETAERISADDLAERIPIEGDDDVSRLTETVNDMLDRLDDALTQQRELLADVRHELRTPLTIVRGHLEVVEPEDAGDVRQVVDLALGEIDRMAELVDGLAALAEVRMAVLRRVPVDVAELTREVGALAAAIPGHPWSVTATAEGVVDADRARLVQAWLQLADNAAKYSPSGAPVEIGSDRSDDTVRLWVRDFGPGVPPGEEERVFERFARVRDAGTARGSGLGLAIVARIAGAHGGTVRYERLTDGSRFAVELPVHRGGRPDDEHPHRRG